TESGARPPSASPTYSSNRYMASGSTSRVEKHHSRVSRSSRAKRSGMGGSGSASTAKRFRACANVTRRPRPVSEAAPHADLRLPRIADAVPDRSAEVEQQPAADLRHDVVVAVGQVEHLEHRLDRVALAEIEQLRRAQVEREELVVLLLLVAADIMAVDE